MRKGLRTLIAGLCTLALTVSPAFAAGGEGSQDVQGPPLSTQDTTSGEMKCTNQENVDLGNNMTRTGSFVLDNKFNYMSLGNDAGKSSLTFGTSSKEWVVKNLLMPRWSPVAAAVFRDQAGKLVDLYGYAPNGGSMSQAGFDAYFNMNNGPKDYKDEVWSCYSLASKLGQASASHAGSVGKDQLLITGPKKISSLNDARNVMGQALRDCQNNDALSVSDFLNAPEPGGDRLAGLKSDDATDGYVNVVTSINCKGNSDDFDYVTFGIAFYDFEAVPVAAEGLQYHSGAFKMSNSDKGENVTTITNGQQQDITHSAVLGDSVTETTSTTLSALASAKMSQNIGANIGWSHTDFNADTKGSFNDDDDDDADGPGWGEKTEGESETTSMGLNWGAAWEMAGAAGVQQGHSKAQELSKAVETTVALPAHTAATIDQKMGTTTYHQYYNQPVILNYKVALFAMSGDYYSSAWFGGMGGINPDRYDKQSMVIKFDTKEETDPSYGCAATDDLTARIENNNIADYDSINGRTFTRGSNASGFNGSGKVDWNSVARVAQEHFGGNLNEVSRQNYFYETPGKLNVDKDKTTSNVQSLYPLFDLATVTTPNSKYVLYTGNSIDRESMTVSAYNKFGVPFYGFDRQWGEWNRCDENGTIINGGNLLDDDPVKVVGSDTITQKEGTTGGTVYLKWMFNNPDPKPKTGEHEEGQPLVGSNIETPMVTIEVLNSTMDDPAVYASGSYSGFWKKQINLNEVLSSEVTDASDKQLGVQPMWENREREGSGIVVDAGTGNVTFTRPGTYFVRPYVYSNLDAKVYPVDETGKAQWIAITATEHDLVHHEGQEPTCTTDGSKDHYRCEDCGKYFSDAAGTTEVASEHVLIPAKGHAWGDWTTTKEATDEVPGEQQRVCANDPSHVETRGLYTVRFEMNGHGVAPERQIVPGSSSATVPADPTATGHIFEGWFADSECTEPYQFGAAVDHNTVVYAKWTVAKYTVAIMAVGDVYEVDGETKVDPEVHGTASIPDGTQAIQTEGEGTYTYYFKEVEYGAPVSLLVEPNEGYGLKGIQAVTFAPNAAMSEPYTPNKVGDTSYSITMPEGDVAIMASFAQVKVTYDGNAPEGVTVSGLPEPATIGYGTIPTKPANPTATGAHEATYDLAGWFSDKELTKPYLFNAPLTQDTTLYAKWMQTGVEKFSVTYTLKNAAGFTPEMYSDGYTVEKGSKAYDPTNDIYAEAGEGVGYELKKDAGTGSTWFTNPECTEPFSFATAIEADTQLYAQVVPKQYTVTYYDGDTALNQKSVVPYNTAIGEAYPGDPSRPPEDNIPFSGWTTKDGTPWSIATTPVTGDTQLFAQWVINRYTVAFDTNGHGEAPATQEVDQASYATDPGAIVEKGHTFGGWFTDQECTEGNQFDFANTKVMDNTTLYAKVTANEYTVTFDTNGHGVGPDPVKVTYGDKVAKPDDPIDLDRTFVGWYSDAACTKPYDFNAPVEGDLTIYARWTAANSVVMYRLYNPYSGEHFYTSSVLERAVLVDVGWNDEDVAWVSPEKSDVPVYRLYNPFEPLGDHHYTTSKAEYDQLVSLGWSGEGVGWYSDENKGMPVYRQYNPNAYPMGLSGSHNYTVSKEENDQLVSLGWSAEGIGWYGLDEGSI